VETVNIRSWSDCEADYDNPIEIAIKMSIDEFESTWGVSAREWLNNKEWKAWIKKHPLEERGIVASRSLINPRRDRRGLVVPDKYLAGLPKHLQEQRVKELSESRMGLRGYQDLPTDIAARRLGITKKGRYSEEAKRRGIEYRGEYADMAVRALLYYGLSDDTKTVTQLAKELEKINKKGLAAWQTGGHRPGASQRSWGTARMASFLVGGKTTWTADNKNFRSLPQALQKAIEAQRVWTRD
jgi:hypothetical protein